MSCEACNEALATDGVEPPCFKEVGAEDEAEPGVNTCRLPQIPEWLQRLFELRDRLITLHELVDAGTILRLYDADIEDIEFLAVIEGELKELADEGDKGDKEANH